jgi:hypothetical protein
MYFLVLLLDALGAVVMVALLRTFDQLELPLVIFFSLFPLGFALLAELLKIEALLTGTTDKTRILVRVTGFMLILLILGLGGYPPFRELWVENSDAWTRPMLGWFAFISLLLVLIPEVQEVRARRRVRYKKLMEGKILP